jgi:hypothetical protein
LAVDQEFREREKVRKSKYDRQRWAADSEFRAASTERIERWRNANPGKEVAMATRANARRRSG